MDPRIAEGEERLRADKWVDADEYGEEAEGACHSTEYDHSLRVIYHRLLVCIEARAATCGERDYTYQEKLDEPLLRGVYTYRVHLVLVIW